MVPQPIAAGGNQPYLDFWAITGHPWYPGYKTPTVASETYVERVVGAVHSMGDIIGTDMILWVLPRDSKVRLWG
jgi:hypothetical protein